MCLFILIKNNKRAYLRIDGFRVFWKRGKMRKKKRGRGEKRRKDERRRDERLKKKVQRFKGKRRRKDERRRDERLKKKMCRKSKVESQKKVATDAQI